MGDRRAHIVVDLGFGDSGKGTIVDALVRKTGAELVVRFNGGAQAGHNVVTSDGQHHTFSQWGAGSFVPGVKTFLTRDMVVHPLAMLAEADHLKKVGVREPFRQMIIDERCIVTTPYHQSMNRLRETMRGQFRHGSCGVGVGETVHDYLHFGDTIRMRDLLDRPLLLKKLEAIRERKLADLKDMDFPLGCAKDLTLMTDIGTLRRCAELFFNLATYVDITADFPIINGDVVLEGAQGILLDEWHGFHPYTTWSTTTSSNAHDFLSDMDWVGEIDTIGVIRTFATRHGAGPFVTENKLLSEDLYDQYNQPNDWQGALRFGWFDVVAANYALAVDGEVDYLAVTHMDKLVRIPTWLACTGYRHEGKTMGILEHNVKPDLNRQHDITCKLLRTSPEYTIISSEGSFDERCEKHIEFIEKHLRRPVRISSIGPTAVDKRFHRPRNV